MLLVAVSFARLAHADSTSAEETDRLLAQIEPRLKAIYEGDEFAIRSFTATWLPDGSGYLKLETSAGASAAEVAHYDSAGGKRTVVVPSEKLVLPGSSQPLMLRWFQRAPSGNRFLLHGDITEGERRSGHWLYEPESGALRPLDDGPGLWFDAHAFSPDCRRLLGSRGAELIVYDIAGGRTIPLTKDSDPVGIAVVPTPQPPYYWAGYQEIYMRTPKDNPEGYRTCAPITYADGLRGDLLIIVGSGETNTHVEITEGLVDRLIELGKRFDYFAYPNRDHGLHEGDGTEVHLRMLIIRYLIEHLPPGPR